jgi:glycosyltransferase involved in cell wall biosynthesis
MKIGVLTHNYPRYRGDFSGRFVEALSEELVAQGHQVAILAPWDAAYARTPSDHRVALELYRYAPRADWHRLGYMRTMRADVALRRMTYLLAPGMFAAGVRAVSAWAGRERPDVLHAHWALPNGFIGAVAARRHGIPLAVSIPGSDATVAAANPIFRRMARFAFDTAGLITANSTALRDVAVNDLGADPAKFDLIAYGVDPNALRPDPSGAAELRASLGIPSDAVVFLAVGRMVYKKGFDRLLCALAVLEAGKSANQRITNSPFAIRHSPSIRFSSARAICGRSGRRWGGSWRWTSACTGSAMCPATASASTTTWPTLW